MEESGIEYSNILLNLGIFSILLKFLLLALFAYGVIYLAFNNIRCCKRVKDKLRYKLFYNVWIRHMLESYLEVTHYCVVFLSISASFNLVSDTISTLIGIASMTIYSLWPVFIIVFLLKKRKMLDDFNFIKQY